MKNALGFIEVVGLASAIQVADVMLKAASVTLVNIEKAKGSGWMTLIVSGDVGAVNAAVESGMATAKSADCYVASRVIARPSEELPKILEPKPKAVNDELESNKNTERMQKKVPIKEKVTAIENVVGKKTIDIKVTENLEGKENLKPTSEKTEDNVVKRVQKSQATTN